MDSLEERMMEETRGAVMIKEESIHEKLIHVHVCITSVLPNAARKGVLPPYTCKSCTKIIIIKIF